MKSEQIELVIKNITSNVLGRHLNHRIGNEGMLNGKHETLHIQSVSKYITSYKDHEFCRWYNQMHSDVYVKIATKVPITVSSVIYGRKG